jgi:2-keto-4-pentenoate hydratase/2-oxohepta-3-ene-1,7-dioic acid hydratase in catechol pathway
MKLVRYGAAAAEKPGLIDSDGVLRDLSSIVDDIDGGLLADLSVLEDVDSTSLPVVEGSPRFGPCVGNVGKLVCIGLNFSDHAIETGNPIPEEPVIFMKATSSICGPNDDVIIPRGATKVDWEVEFGIVIGKAAKYVDKSTALEHIAGYCVVHDVSEREFQIEREGQWTKGKSCDTFAPLGPYVVTRDEIADPQNLKMWCDVNGERRQSGSTKTMIQGAADLVAYLSQFMTLHPGDVISTGTPPGVGLGMKPPVYLKAGDVVELGIEGLGKQRQNFVADV